MPSSKNDHRSGKSRLEQGREYERLAGEFYVEHGFAVLERNWRAGHKEIDLIVRKDDLIAFVEVKSATTRRFGHPAERVDQRKINNLFEAAKQYLIVHDIVDTDLRFDVVTFVDGQLEFFPDAFQPNE